jgi:hypothetical protein
VNFVIDDTANKVFKDGEAQWKGQFAYDAVTRVSFNDANWGGPYAALYDDGPWSGYASGNTIKYGHEPAGSVAGDHILGVTVFVYTPTAAQTYSYGLIDHAFGDGWIWPASTNGSFTVNPGATTAVTATGATLAPFGTTDMQLQLDTANLQPNCVPVAPATTCTPTTNWDFAGGIKVKGSAWGWYEVSTTNTGGVYSFTLSDFAGAGKQLYHTGLTKAGDTPAFVFVFYAADGTTSKEYKVGSVPPATGVTAGTKASGATVWTPATVVNQAAGDKNTYITVP